MRTRQEEKEVTKGEEEKKFTNSLKIYLISQACEKYFALNYDEKWVEQTLDTVLICVFYSTLMEYCYILCAS